MERRRLEQALYDSYERWEKLSREGGSDPSYADGMNLNLVRNHILSFRKKLEELDPLAPILKREIPEKADPSYMVNPDKIRENARNTLALYEADAAYEYLLQRAGYYDKKAAYEIGLTACLGYVSALRRAIDEDDLVVMRRHRKAEYYLARLRDCRLRLEKM